MTPEPSKDYLTSYAEREARERLQQRLTPRPSPTESSAIQPRETTMVLKAWVSHTLVHASQNRLSGACVEDLSPVHDRRREGARCQNIQSVAKIA